MLGASNVGVVVVVVQTLETIHVAISGGALKQIYAILAAFFPEATVVEWTVESRLPTRDLRAEAFESCWSILHGDA